MSSGRKLLRVVGLAATAVAAGSIRAAVLRGGEAGPDSDSRERGDAQYDFRNSFHCNSPVLMNFFFREIENGAIQPFSEQENAIPQV